MKLFAEISAGNARLLRAVEWVRTYFEQHANRRTGFVVATCALVAVFIYFEIVRPPADFPVGELVTVPEGASFESVATNLEEQHVVRSAMGLRIIAKLRGLEGEAHAGDYLFKKQANMFTVLSRISQGVFGLEPVTVRIPEGITMEQMASIYEKKLLRFDRDRFISLASGEEGFLFPDTYHFLPNTPETQIIAAMRDNFDQHWDELDPALISATHLTQEELVTLASIVELEARNYDDRRKIAGVLYNRLAIDMPLQVDVSFVYLLGKGTYDLSLEDLKHDSPYNTYTHRGLPPGPIGAPSMSALKAVVDPYTSEWLFYLADKSGVTHFSATYAEHLRKKRLYID